MSVFATPAFNWARASVEKKRTKGKAIIASRNRIGHFPCMVLSRRSRYTMSWAFFNITSNFSEKFSTIFLRPVKLLFNKLYRAFSIYFMCAVEVFYSCFFRDVQFVVQAVYLGIFKSYPFINSHTVVMPPFHHEGPGGN